jgi:hypothetical protein
MPKPKPEVFIGSSTEDFDVAVTLKEHLEHCAACRIWKEGVFGLGEHILESLIRTASAVDFAILVVSPNDLIESRGETNHAPRDNVVFEAGLFNGTLGPTRMFMVYDTQKDIKLPSDLSGITVATYSSGDSALAHAAYRIEHSITENGIRPQRLSQLLVGRWTYQVRGADGDYQHRGDCDIINDESGLKFQGVRTMHGESGDSREVKIFWNSRWAAVFKRNTVRFDYEVALPTGRARGYVTLHANDEINQLRGEFSYLAPESRYGTIEFQRIDGD